MPNESFNLWPNFEDLGFFLRLFLTGQIYSYFPDDAIHIIIVRSKLIKQLVKTLMDYQLEQFILPQKTVIIQLLLILFPSNHFNSFRM